MRSEGFLESFNFSFVSESVQQKWIANAQLPGFSFKNKPVKIKNPLSDELSVMRQSLFSGLMQSCLHNVRHSLNAGRVYEVGYTFDSQANTETEYFQNLNLGFISWGQQNSLWASYKPEALFFESKAVIENFLRSFLIKSYKFETCETVPFLHPGQCAVLKAEGRPVGYMGCLHPVLLEDEKIRVPVVYAELNLEILLKGQPRKYRTKSISKFPMVERDLAFVMPKTFNAGDLIADMTKAAGSVLKSVAIFDVFEGGSLQPHEKSVAYRFLYQDMEKTLTDQELQALDQKIIVAMRQKYSISVR
jgi:phenylalanyl-tRNA synthetase beta chain